MSKSTGTCNIEKAANIYSALRRARPRTKQDLKNYVKVFLGIDVPDKRICPEHNGPMDYLWHSFSADFAAEGKANADAIVWANRADGKTELAAVATLLDCVFKPNCRVRILGGSGEQSGRMYQYLTAFLWNGFEQFLAGPALKAKCRFVNGSSVEVLTQSATSVRGQHIHKLRCDEVELFDEDVFAAAKFTTQSTENLVAAMELIYRALDFGFVNPFVCLWIQVDSAGVVRVIDEYVRSRATIDVHVDEIKSRTPGTETGVAATFCDPAGAGVNDVTGTSTVREMRTMGIIARFRRSGILEGIELIRRAVRSGDGKSRLVISPRCQRLIEAMRCYHYPESGSAAAGELPLKDGIYDHPIDALRYFFVNHTRPTKTTTRRY